MKNIKITVAAIPVLALLLACSCMSTEREVRNVAQHYLDATSRYDVPDACRFCTPETAKGLQMVNNTIMRNVDPEYIELNKQAKVKITSVTLTSDTTAVVAFRKRTPLANNDGDLDLVFRDGRWMANVDINIPPILLQGEYNFDPEKVDIGPLKTIDPKDDSAPKQTPNPGRHNSTSTR